LPGITGARVGPPAFTICILSAMCIVSGIT
jgi:hypothetical protein